jgi:poly(glycerol-phosphate) alpha-glucosyltransferase
MLHRSRSFASIGGAPVDILTFDDFRDYSVLRGVLKERGFLSEGTRVLNLWEDLPAMAEFIGSQAAKSSVPEGEKFPSFNPLSAQTVSQLVEVEGPHKRLVRYADDGQTQLQVDHFRSDGSLLLSDRHDARQMGVHGGRSMTLCDATGLPIQDWGSAWALYRSWLDYVVNGDEAYFVVDNKNTARFMASYQRDNAVVLYMVHENHLEDPAGGFASEMNASAKALFPRLDALDGVVYLTEQQSADVRKRYSQAGNTYVIPNGRSIDSAPEPDGIRSPRTGMQAASLIYRKRVDHSVRAIHLANSMLSAPVGLKVFGDGSRRLELEELIVDLNETDNVQLMGHVTNAQSHFKEASFSLLTSTSEALPLALVESMAAGCIPIVYDLPYGPASVITNGVDGFLVEYGNVEELARCIAAFVDMPLPQQEQMRSAARRRAEDFSDERVVALWSEKLRDAAGRKSLPSPQLEVSITDTACGVWTDGALEIRVTAELGGEFDSAHTASLGFYCRLKNRDTEDFFRTDGERHPSSSGSTYTNTFRFSADIVDAMKDSVVDATVETHLLGRRVLTRLPLTAPAGAPMEAYATVHGNLSLRRTSPTPAVAI